MRTKTLLAAAAIIASGLASSMAQSNVYSQNVVGYVNATYTGGQFAMLANPLNGTNNTLPNVIQNPRSGTVVYKWVVTSFVPNGFVSGAWSPSGSNATLNPGEGAFIFIPAGPNYTNTYVGEVMQGSLTNPCPVGFAMQGSMVPQAGRLQADLGYPVVNGLVVYRWVQPSFVPSGYVAGSWPGGPTGDPTINVAEGFFASRPAASSANWVRNFTVQ